MPEWWEKAGSELAAGWKGVFDGCQADQEWLRKVFKLKRFLAEMKHMKKNISWSAQNTPENG